MTTIDVNRPEVEAAGEPGTIGAGSAIYRRLDRRPRRSNLMMAIPLAVLAVAATGGVIAYESMSKTPPPPAPAPVAAQTAAQPATLTPAAPAPVQTIATPTPVPAAQPPAIVKTERPHVAVASVTRARAPKAANAAATGEDANAYMPPVTAPPAPTTAQPSFSVPLPATSAAPAAQSAAPVNPPQPAPAPQQ